MCNWWLLTMVQWLVFEEVNLGANTENKWIYSSQQHEGSIVSAPMIGRVLAVEEEEKPWGPLQDPCAAGERLTHTGWGDTPQHCALDHTLYEDGWHDRVPSKCRVLLRCVLGCGRKRSYSLHIYSMIQTDNSWHSHSHLQPVSPIPLTMHIFRLLAEQVEPTQTQENMKSSRANWWAGAYL